MFDRENQRVHSDPPVKFLGDPGDTSLDAVSNNLRTWSTVDFSSFYVHNRAHLVAHAARFLHDSRHQEEVVQEAFLYVMTSLPELETELDVLRYLKWKVKMLCLDLLKSSQQRLEESHEFTFEDIGEVRLPDPAEHIERAEDLAIVSAAFARLTLRQQQALYESLVEDRPNAEIASKLELSENAARQLLHRARASLRVLITDEAAARGIEVSQLLSTSVRRASSWIANRGGGFLLIPVLTLGGIGLVQTFASSIQDPASLSLSSPISEETMIPNPGEFPMSTESETKIADAVEEKVSNSAQDNELTFQTGVPGESGIPELASEPADESPPPMSTEDKLRVVLASEVGASLVGKSEIAQELFKLEQQAFEVVMESGAVLGLTLTGDGLQIQVRAVTQSGAEVAMVPQSVLTTSPVVQANGTTVLSFGATDFITGDLSGEFDSVTASPSDFQVPLYMSGYISIGLDGDIHQVSFSWLSTDQVILGNLP